MKWHRTEKLLHNKFKHHDEVLSFLTEIYILQQSAGDEVASTLLPVGTLSPAGVSDGKQSSSDHLYSLCVLHVKCAFGPVVFFQHQFLRITSWSQRCSKMSRSSRSSAGGGRVFTLPGRWADSVTEREINITAAYQMYCLELCIWCSPSLRLSVTFYSGELNKTSSAFSLLGYQSLSSADLIEPVWSWQEGPSHISTNVDRISL